MTIERRLDARDEVRLAELMDRQVDRDPHVDAVLRPRGHLRARGLDDPVAERVDQAEAFGERDEEVGADHAAHRMMPAQQRLDAADHVPARVDLRLIVQFELPAIDGLAQVVDEVELVGHVAVHVRLEQRVRPATGALRGLHGRVGLGQQTAAIAMIGIDDHADRHADLHRSSHDLQRLLRRFEDAHRQRHAVVARRRAFHEDEELIAADARDGVVVARGDAQPFG